MIATHRSHEAHAHFRLRSTVPAMVRTVLMSLLIVLGAGACSAAPSEPERVDDPVLDQTGTSATLVHVVDGDSIDVEINGRAEEVRMIGLNAPEGDECFGERARDALVAYLEDGDLVLIEGSGDPVDHFGRLLRYIYVGGDNVNGRMLADGNAVTLQSDHRDRELFVEIGNVAADAGRGMWAADACGPPPPPGMSIAQVQYNPPGPDDEVLNDEFVILANEGGGDIELAGWILRDESSQNRYVFGGPTLGAGDSVTVRTGCGTNRPGTVHWCSERSVWSNGGDTVILQDQHGNVADRWNYQGTE
jgi:micrococcal nuclease